MVTVVDQATTSKRLADGARQKKEGRPIPEVVNKDIHPVDASHKPSLQRYGRNKDCSLRNTIKAWTALHHSCLLLADSGSQQSVLSGPVLMRRCQNARSNLTLALRVYNERTGQGCSWTSAGIQYSVQFNS